MFGYLMQNQQVEDTVAVSINSKFDLHAFGQAQIKV